MYICSPRSALALLLGLSLGLFAAGDGRADGPRKKPRSFAEQRESLVTLLNAHEPELRRSVLDTIGPDVGRLLVDVASHPKERPTVRVRAVTALVNYPTEDTRSFLQSLLHERNLTGSDFGDVMRGQAIRCLGRAFGETSVDVIASLRGDTSRTIRSAVARGLGETGSAKAQLILESWLGQEEAISVKQAIDRGLLKLRGY